MVQLSILIVVVITYACDRTVQSYTPLLPHINECAYNW